MARPPSPYRKTLVEDCEVISVSTTMGNLAIYGISFEGLALKGKELTIETQCKQAGERVSVPEGFSSLQCNTPPL
jgi:hypothetical protein